MVGVLQVLMQRNKHILNLQGMENHNHYDVSKPVLM
jgi:hypothetical protein